MIVAMTMTIIKTRTYRQPIRDTRPARTGARPPYRAALLLYYIVVVVAQHARLRLLVTSIYLTENGRVTIQNNNNHAIGMIFRCYIYIYIYMYRLRGTSTSHLQIQQQLSLLYLPTDLQYVIFVIMYYLLIACTVCG